MFPYNISLVETNLLPDISSDAELGLSGFTILMCGRSKETSNKTSGGRALIAIYDNITCSQTGHDSKKFYCLFVLYKFPSS